MRNIIIHDMVVMERILLMLIQLFMNFQLAQMHSCGTENEYCLNDDLLLRVIVGTCDLVYSSNASLKYTAKQPLICNWKE